MNAKAAYFLIMISVISTCTLFPSYPAALSPWWSVDALPTSSWNAKTNNSHFHEDLLPEFLESYEHPVEYWRGTTTQTVMLNYNTPKSYLSHWTKPCGSTSLFRTLALLSLLRLGDVSHSYRWVFKRSQFSRVFVSTDLGASFICSRCLCNLHNRCSQ